MLDQEFGWIERTARRYAQVAEAFALKSDTMSDFNGLTIDAIRATPSPLQVCRNQQGTRLSDARSNGEHITKGDAEAMIAKARQQGRAKAEQKMREGHA